MEQDAASSVTYAAPMRVTLSVVVRGLVSAALALGAALLVQYLFLVGGVSDSNPPSCTSQSGSSVDCDLQGHNGEIFLAVFLGVLVALVAVQVAWRKLVVARGVDDSWPPT